MAELHDHCADSHPFLASCRKADVEQGFICGQKEGNRRQWGRKSTLGFLRLAPKRPSAELPSSDPSYKTHWSVKEVGQWKSQTNKVITPGDIKPREKGKWDSQKSTCRLPLSPSPLLNKPRLGMTAGPTFFLQLNSTAAQLRLVLTCWLVG